VCVTAFGLCLCVCFGHKNVSSRLSEIDSSGNYLQHLFRFVFAYEMKVGTGRLSFSDVIRSGFD